MHSIRRSTTIAGALAVIGMLAGLLSIVPVLEKPDYLALLSAHERQIVIGACFQLLMTPASIGFALALEPTLKAGSEALTLGFVGFRLIAGACHLLGVTLLPLFIILGQTHTAAGAEAPLLQLLGDLLRSGRDLVNHVALIVALAISDLILFRIVQRWRLVPSWLTTWGFLGAGLAILASLLLLSGQLHVVTPSYLAMNAPLALHTLVLAGWLIVRGFDTSQLQPHAIERGLP